MVMPVTTLVSMMEKEQAIVDDPRPPNNDCGKSASISKWVPCFLRFGGAYNQIEYFIQISRAYEPITEAISKCHDQAEPITEIKCQMTNWWPSWTHNRDKMPDDKLMSRFINDLFHLTLQNFLIARMWWSFTKTCTIIMTFDDVAEIRVCVSDRTGPQGSWTRE